MCVLKKKMDELFTHLIIVVVIAIAILLLGHFVLTPTATMGLALVAGGTLVAFAELSTDSAIFAWTVVTMNGIGVIALLFAILHMRYKHVKCSVNSLRQSGADGSQPAAAAPPLPAPAPPPPRIGPRPPPKPPRRTASV